MTPRRGERRRGRPPGGRRVTDEILDLATHGSAFVTCPQLADYWGVHRATIARWCCLGRLRATLHRRTDAERGDADSPALHGQTHEWRILVSDALVFELTDPFWTIRSRQREMSEQQAIRARLAAAEAVVARLRGLIFRRPA